MSYTKQEVYSSIIDIQKKTGQGLSGIVKIKSADYSRYIDELIEEGLVKACDTGGSIGHPESNIFYVPTKGYNVWEDNGGEGIVGIRQGPGKYLHFVRLYVGGLKFEDRKKLKDEQEELKHKFMNPTIYDYLRDPNQMKLYAAWLERNHEELEIMMNLDDYYKHPDISFTEEELNSIKDLKSYSENENVSTFLSKSIKHIDTVEEEISIIDRIITLCENDKEKYKEKLDSSIKDKEKCKKEILFRRKLNSWLQQKSEDALIQDLID